MNKGPISVGGLLFSYIIALPLYYELNRALGMKVKVDQTNVNIVGL